MLAGRWKLADQALYQKLIACYSEPHRRYHTLIYSTARFIERYEPRARANLARSVARL